MKRCPKCEADYNDNSLVFCLQDCAPLIPVPTPKQAADTLIIPNRLKVISKSRPLLLILLIAISLAAILVILQRDKSQIAAPPPQLRQTDDAGESTIFIDKAVASLDMISSWVELNEKQRKELRASKAMLHGDFVVRKYAQNAQFGHRLGTTSRFEPEWRSSTHQINGKRDERKCSPEVQYSYMLYFDLLKEGIDIPFNLSYEIDFWNAHNGLKGDWHSFYVAHPTGELTIKVRFPKQKPYTRYRLKSVYGKDCAAIPEIYDNPDVHEGVDSETGAKTISWTIPSPKVHWIYRIEWDW